MISQHVGRAFGIHSQHLSMISHNKLGHSSGRVNTPFDNTKFITSSLLMPEKERNFIIIGDRDDN